MYIVQDAAILLGERQMLKFANLSSQLCKLDEAGDSQVDFAAFNLRDVALWHVNELAELSLPQPFGLARRGVVICFAYQNRRLIYLS